MNEKLQQIEKVIREACPELIRISEDEGDTGYYRQIHLEHILRTMDNNECYSIIGDSDFDLTKPLQEQSHQFVDWLHSVLVIE